MVDLSPVGNAPHRSDPCLPTTSLVRQARIAAWVDEAKIMDRMDEDDASGMSFLNQPHATQTKRALSSFAKDLGKSIGLSVDSLDSIAEPPRPQELTSVDMTSDSPQPTSQASPAALVPFSSSLRKKRSRLTIGLPSFWAGNGAHPLLRRGLRRKRSANLPSLSDNVRSGLEKKLISTRSEIAMSKGARIGGDSGGNSFASFSAAPGQHTARPTSFPLPLGTSVKIRSFGGEVLHGAVPGDDANHSVVSPLVAGSARLVRSGSVRSPNSK